MWLLGFVFDVQRVDKERPGGYEGRQLARTLVLMDVVRGPQVVLDGGRVALSMFVRGVDEDDATHRALSVIDVATAQVSGLRLGELLERWALSTEVASESASPEA